MLKPDWLQFSLPNKEEYFWLKRQLREGEIRTICEDARCPNIGYCFSQKTATFLILGDICTRNCSFCAVKKGKPNNGVDEKEIIAIMNLVKKLNLDYVVITSVTRDDLPDGGAEHYFNVISELRKNIDNIMIETLIPDFKNDVKAFNKILESPPDVLNHNVETVKELYNEINRPINFYRKSLDVLNFFGKRGLITKSGLMVGLGETKEQLKQTMDDIVNQGVKILTIGQYLQPTKKNHPVVKYYTPEEFEELREVGLRLGFYEVVSAPLVRSSFKAKEVYKRIKSALSNIQ